MCLSVHLLTGSVWKLSCDRLHVLEEALPMVQHFHEHHADIGTWLEEISNEVTSLGSTVDSPEQIKKQQDALKVSMPCSSAGHVICTYKFGLRAFY